MNISKTASETYKFSVFSLSDKSCGVLIKGGKYSLDDAEIANSFPLGAGNYRNAGENVIIGCKKGILLTVFNLL
jgi:thiamine pyrophosphokinase